MKLSNVKKKVVVVVNYDGRSRSQVWELAFIIGPYCDQRWRRRSPNEGAFVLLRWEGNFVPQRRITVVSLIRALLEAA